MDIVKYTDDEIRKNIALLEIHLKQFQLKSCDCDCPKKHILILEGLAEEGVTACADCGIEKYKLLLEFLEKIKDKDYKNQGIEFAREARKIRIEFVPCDEGTGTKTKDDINKKIKELEEEKELAEDNHLKDRLDFGRYLLEWVLRGKGCS